MATQPVTAIISTLGGRTLEVEMASGSTIYELKQKVLKEWGVPPCGQKMFLGTAQLVDASFLDDLSVTDGTLQISIITDTGVLIPSRMAQLQAHLVGIAAETSQERKAAKKNLLAFVDVADRPELEEVLKGLTCLLSSGQSETRKLALLALQQIVPKGHSCTKFIVNELEDPDPYTRQVAVDTLLKLVQRGDDEVVWSLKRTCTHRQSFVRLAAIEALGELAPLDDKQSIELLNGIFDKDDDESVRQACMNAMSQLLAVA
eukprot:TRINITY_DN93058_c0_g1_i1.p1 TRINITY_DN93058_c0_g1~~TRINITY_DN93058_c0_g1_i1.p1  ORF type:complete len:260 (+),score=53.32 TRINITY_DN93058_c0_g1_i1:77-856(+)